MQLGPSRAIPADLNECGILTRRAQPLPDLLSRLQTPIGSLSVEKVTCSISVLRGVCMRRTIEYYFSMHSPWAYIGHVPFLEFVGRSSLSVSY